MGFLKSWFKKGVGLVGKHLMDTANSFTGGLAGKILDKGVSIANKHSGLIGKTLNAIGKDVFSDETRKKMSNFADKALKYIPDGKIKDTLSKINDAAQGRQNVKPINNTQTNKQINSNSIQTIERPKRKSS